MNDFLALFYNLILGFFASGFVSSIFMVALAGLGMIYIIKKLILFRRDYL